MKEHLMLIDGLKKGKIKKVSITDWSEFIDRQTDGKGNYTHTEEFYYDGVFYRNTLMSFDKDGKYSSRISLKEVSDRFKKWDEEPDYILTVHMADGCIWMEGTRQGGKHED